MGKTFNKIAELNNRSVEAQRESVGKLYDPASPVFHYTTLDALINIVGNNCLWASHSRFLNDTEEVVHGAQTIQTVLKERLEAKPDANEHKLLEYIHFRLEDILKAESNFVDYYVTSFSRDGDSLSQWRGYGDVAIEFDFIPLLRHEIILDNQQSRRVMPLLDVIYGRERFKKLVDELVSFSFEQLRVSPDTDLWARGLANAISTLVCISKHDTFYEESETRFVYLDLHEDVDSPRLKERYRTRNQRIVPYVELQSANRLPIKAIWLSPLLRDNTATEESIKYFLRTVGRTEIQVLSSNSPYRS